ncbi:PQQ-binding-like beta-propeller repeat protein [Streptomyces sp. NPDC056909]|uniref:outer membrane protein assembly factor BamB family protein n=1 Tax=Streptomyces sp. NPDC056909 TaxID=3345963 RepID=UPI0036A5D0AC
MGADTVRRERGTRCFHGLPGVRTRRLLQRGPLPRGADRRRVRTCRLAGAVVRSRGVQRYRCAGRARAAARPRFPGRFAEAGSHRPGRGYGAGDLDEKGGLHGQGGVLRPRGALQRRHRGRSLVGRDAATGAELWSTPWPGGGPVCQPLVFDDAPYAACSGTPEEGTTFLRLDPGNGTPEEIIHMKGLAIAVGLDGGDLIVLIPDAEAVPEERFRSLLRVDVRTGSRRTVKLSERPVGAATLVGDRLFFVQDTGRVTAVDTTTGDRLWSEDTAVDLLGPPIASEREGAVHLSSYSGRLVALDLRTGRKRWQTTAMGTSAFGSSEGAFPMRTGGSLVTRANGSLRSIDPLHPNTGRRPAGAGSLPPEERAGD